MSDAPDHTLPDAAHDAALAGSDSFAEAGAGEMLALHDTGSTPSSPPAEDLAARVAVLLADLIRDTVVEVLRDEQLRKALGDDQLVTREELAKLLGFHAKTVQRLEREGKLPAAGRIGDTPVFSLGTVRAVIRSATTPVVPARKAKSPAARGGRKSP